MKIRMPNRSQRWTVAFQISKQHMRGKELRSMIGRNFLPFARSELSALFTFRPQQVDISRARQSESNYENSIEAYKETPMYKFLQKWKRRRQVRKKKKALRRANRSLRSHYYVRLLSVNELDVHGDKIVYELGIHIRCIRYIINDCCIWLPTAKPGIP